MSVDHYENFPVASWLCPPSLRPAVAAIYWFARTADDIADEGDAPAAERRAQLADYRQALAFAARGETDPRERWPEVFGPLRDAIAHHHLSEGLLSDLLDAFEQDLEPPHYSSRSELLDYCRRSANPVGRLLLHLYGIVDDVSLRRSDAVCTALQLINFWQDLSTDLRRGRHYVPEEDLFRFGMQREELRCGADTERTQALVAALCDWAALTMHTGAPLALRVPGRAGWELRLVVQGGLRILEKIRRMHHRTLSRRPALSAWDGPLLLTRALAMRGRELQ